MAVETAEQRAAKLAELRRLTPEQEAAAAKAAQRIDKRLLPAMHRHSMEDDYWTLRRYVSNMQSTERQAH